MPRRLLPMLVALCGSPAFAQLISPAPPCAVVDQDATYRIPPLTYPLTSNRYAVQYQLGSAGAWVSAPVYISYYGGTNASPSRTRSGYPADESMSFVSIPAAANTAVAVRVSKIWGSPFPALGQMSVRPAAKGIQLSSVDATTVQFVTTTAAGFAGDQFVLWWTVSTQESSAIQGLVVLLNPPYNTPAGANVKPVHTANDLTADLSNFDTLDFEGTVVIGTSGAVAFPVPANIKNVFLAPGAWVQGKLRFIQDGTGSVRRIYGPGVLDVSRFEYDLRRCDDSSGYGDQGYNALSWVDPPAKTTADSFILDGLVIIDHNHAVTDLLVNGSVNNVNSIGWNGINGGFRLGQNTKVSNLFIRACDDSLMMWGAFITVTNATVWQNYNGGVVNLGWSDDSPGDYSLIDGLYVVKTDWSANNPGWSDTTLNGQNDAIVASLMVPGTMFGAMQPSLYRNIFVDDPPQTLLSLKILFPECNDPNSPRLGDCKQVDLTLPGKLNLYLENVFTQHITGETAIGFQNLPPGFTSAFPNGYTLTGSMNIGLSNVVITKGDGTVKVLTAANAVDVGKLTTNGDGIDIMYGDSSTTMLLSASPNSITAGQSVTFTATVAPAGATGAVSFFDGATSLGTATLSAGAAGVSATSLAAGNHVVTAFYTGDTNYDPNVSAPVTLAVAPICDINQDGTTNASDVMRIIREVLGKSPATDDMNHDNTVNVADVQIVINAAVGFGCSALQH